MSGGLARSVVSHELSNSGRGHGGMQDPRGLAGVNEKLVGSRVLHLGPIYLCILSALHPASWLSDLPLTLTIFNPIGVIQVVR